MKRTGAQVIVRLLEMHGIRTAAGIPGGSILPLYDELSRSQIRHILVRQEQAGGFIAQGMARATGKPAVCFATSGPGVMNLLTAVADARCDSVPIIAITGQVNTDLIGTDAFQEADTFGLSFPITKHSMLIKTPRQLLTAIPAAFAIAAGGRPGPVLIDVPRDVQLAECEFDSWPEIQDPPPVRFHTGAEELARLMRKAAGMLLEARRPVLFCGGGCNSPAAAREIRLLAAKYRLPAVSSLMGLGCVSTADRDFAGMVGMHGSCAANRAVYESDLVLALGVRFDDRAVGAVRKFCPGAKIIHIDIDAAEINKILPASVSAVADVESAVPVLSRFLDELSGARVVPHRAAENNGAEQSAARSAPAQSAGGAASRSAAARGEWADAIAALKRETFSAECGRPRHGKKDGAAPVNPRALIAAVPELSEQAGTGRDRLLVTTDVGQHQMWAAQYYPVTEPRTFLTSGSLGTMGFGLPAAIGAALVSPEKRVVCFSGDGSILMNIQELATLSELNLAVTVIVFENGTLGMVRQQQKFLFDRNFSASGFPSRPDLLAVARGFGIEAVDADSDKDWHRKAFDPNRTRKPVFVRVRIDPEEDVLPFVPGGRANIDAIRGETPQ